MLLTYLFVPLGIQPAYWRQDQQGYNIGCFGLGLSARDLAKFGFLYLNNGYWNGQSIVSEIWVKESTSQQIQTVTGSAPCSLIPYWSKRLEKKSMSALQLSSRVGQLQCEDLGERVLISGKTVTYLEGRITV